MRIQTVTGLLIALFLINCNTDSYVYMSDNSAANLEAANTYLENNKTLEGVVETESGLQYLVYEAGTGDKPTAQDTVRIMYEGQTLTGGVFDSSYDDDTPVEFHIDNLIPGMKEGLQLMREGSTWMLYIHPDLGYGNQYVGEIQPNSLLIFYVELIEIVSQ